MAIPRLQNEAKQPLHQAHIEHHCHIGRDHGGGPGHPRKRHEKGRRPDRHRIWHLYLYHCQGHCRRSVCTLRPCFNACLRRWGTGNTSMMAAGGCATPSLSVGVSPTGGARSLAILATGAGASLLFASSTHLNGSLWGLFFSSPRCLFFGSLRCLFSSSPRGLFLCPSQGPSVSNHFQDILRIRSMENFMPAPPTRS